MKNEIKLITNGSNNYFNREISWLQFNLRVLQEAQNEHTPLLERLRFISIAYSNLDEFFMVRVAGKKTAAKEHLFTTDSPDLTPYGEILSQIHRASSDLLWQLYDTWDEIMDALSAYNVSLCQYEDLAPTDQKSLNDYFLSSIHPILTPLAFDPAHPFPFLSNLGLYLLIEFDTPRADADFPAIAFVEIPKVLPRFVNVDEFKFVLLEDVVQENLSSLFWGLEVKHVYQVRVTRDLDFNLLENEVVDLLQSVKNEVRAREQSAAVRLETSEELPKEILELLYKSLSLGQLDTFVCDGPLGLNQIDELVDLPIDSLKFDNFNPRIPSQLKANRNIFSIIRDEEIILHHPYESFYTVIEFLRKAATDPKVLAIKQTLYRTSGDSPIIESLVDAAQNGKQVTAVVELKARFDEKNNITWARELERAGVNVVYGFIGLKTHAKATLVVRQEEKGIRRYVHLSTGNYNSSTAKVYTDIALMSAHEEICLDIANLFNLLTGFNIFSNHYNFRAANYPRFKQIKAAPLELRDSIIAMVNNEILQAKEGKRAEIFIKANALVDKAIIDKFYEASNAGVKVRLLIRGICCLRPGVEKMSENIEVRSVVGRFLEHSRIYYFYAEGAESTYLSSADMMPRNMDRRVEIMFPILNQGHKDRIISEILSTYWSDNTKSRKLSPDGRYEFVSPDKNAKKVQAQLKLIELARVHGLKSLPYEKAIWHNPRGNKSRPLAKREHKSILRLKEKRHRKEHKDR